MGHEWGKAAKTLELRAAARVPQNGICGVPAHQVAWYDQDYALSIRPLFMRPFRMGQVAKAMARNTLTTAE